MAHKNRTIGRRLFADQNGRAGERLPVRPGKQSYKPNQDDKSSGYVIDIDNIHNSTPYKTSESKDL
jgi:hypothetical protein